MVRREGIENTSVVTPLVDDNAGVRIVGRGTLAESGLPFVLVSSASEPGRVHCVAYAYEGAYVGSRIHCDCVAASSGRGCKHVRLVSAWLAALMERAPLDPLVPPQSPAAEQEEGVTTSAKKRPSAQADTRVRRGHGQLDPSAPLDACRHASANPRAATTGAKKRAPAPAPPDVAGETMVNRTRPFSLMKT